MENIENLTDAEKLELLEELKQDIQNKKGSKTLDDLIRAKLQKKRAADLEEVKRVFRIKK